MSTRDRNEFLRPIAKVSIIIPAYNAERYLSETIKSVLAQTFTQWELIVVDDGSRDGTLQIAQEYEAQDARVRALSKANGGVASSRNIGFAAASPEAEFVCYLDHDDMWETDALATLLQALEAHPEAVAAHGLPRGIDGEGRYVGELEVDQRVRYAVQKGAIITLEPNAPTTFACFVYHWTIQTPGLVMIRRTAHTQAGLFDKTLNGCDDWDLWVRLCRLGDMVFVNRVILRYRQHDSNLSLQREKLTASEQRLDRRILTWQDEIPERRRLARAGYNLRYQRKAGERLGWAKENIRAGKLWEAMKHMRHAALVYQKVLATPK